MFCLAVNAHLRFQQSFTVAQLVASKLAAAVAHASACHG